MTPQPSDNRETVRENQERQEQELLFALHERDRPTVVFLELNSPRKTAELEAFLIENLPEYQFHTIDLTPHPTVSLLRALTERLPTEVVQSTPVQYVVNVKGLENSLLVNQAGRIEPSRLTAQLNLERELLFRNVPYIILIWADTHFFRTLQHEAPDLWSWVTYKFRFEDTEAFAPDQHPPLPPERLSQRGYTSERLTRIYELEETLARLNQNTPDKIRLQRDKVSILHLLAQEYEQAYKFAKAEAAYKNAIAIAERIRADYFQRGQLAFNLGTLYLTTRRFEEAMAQYETAKSLAEEDQFGVIFHQIGGVYQEKEQWDLALTNYQQAIEWYEKTGNEFEIGSTYHQIGRVYEEQQLWVPALASYQQAVDWKTKTGNEFELGATYHQIGIVYQKQEQWVSALASYEKAIDWNTKTGNQFALGATYHQIGSIYQEQREWDSALVSYQQAVDWKTKTGNEFALGSTYHQIGSVYEEKGEIDTALCWYKNAVENLERFNHPALSIAEEALLRVREKLKQT